MLDRIIQLLIQIGAGSIIGVVFGMIFQYFISKKLKVVETKLVIFRRVYKQLYYFVLMNHEKIALLSDSPNSGISTIDVAGGSGLDLKKDLGDILYYVSGDLEKKIANLIYNLYFEGAVINKRDIADIESIMEKLKKFV